MSEIRLVCAECDTVFDEPEDNPMNPDCLCPECESWEIEKAKDDDDDDRSIWIELSFLTDGE